MWHIAPFILCLGIFLFAGFRHAQIVLYYNKTEKWVPCWCSSSGTLAGPFFCTVLGAVGGDAGVVRHHVEEG